MESNFNSQQGRCRINHQTSNLPRWLDGTNKPPANGPPLDSSSTAPCRFFCLLHRQSQQKGPQLPPSSPFFPLLSSTVADTRAKAGSGQSPCLLPHRHVPSPTLNESPPPLPSLLLPPRHAHCPPPPCHCCHHPRKALLLDRPPRLHPPATTKDDDDSINDNGFVDLFREAS